MSHSTLKYAIALGLAGAVAIGAATPSGAAPVLSNTAAVKAAAPSNFTETRWRGGGAFAGGLALGFLGAAAFGAPYWGPGPYWSYYPYYDSPYGYYGYAAYPPPYPGWRWRHRHRWHHYYYW